MIDGETESRWCNFEIRFSILKNFLQNLLKHIRKVGRLSCAFSKKLIDSALCTAIV